MTHRSPILVVLLTVLTLGLYWVYWMWTTAAELNRSGAAIPHPILGLVPIVNLWWMWRWSQGVAVGTNGDWSTLGTFVLLLLLPGIGAAILQSAFNRHALPAGAVPA